MNETECENLIKSVKWTDPTNLISLVILEFINILVISGNLLVIAAVFCSNKLRSVTNFFIVNLAVADLLVGLAVLPFSATWEVFKVWIFGDVWCRIWLAVDVWMCTASILNLCAISLDRYVAVTRPVTYPSIMSKKRAKSLIAGIWVLSFVICFPPLVGWKDQKPLAQPLTYTEGNQTLFYATAIGTKVAATTTTSAAAIDVTINETLLTTTTWSHQTVAKLFQRNKRNHHYKRTAMATVTVPLNASSIKRLDLHTNDYNTQNLQINNDAILPIQNDANNNSNDYANDYANHHHHHHHNDNNSNKVISTPLTVYYEPTVSSSSSSSSFNSASVSTILSTSTNIKQQFNDETVFERTLNENKNKNNFNNNYNNNNVNDISANCPWKCELTNDRGYVLYSALGSFYIPMFVMLFFYWRIYRAAIRTTKAINQGFKTTKGGSSHDTNVNRDDETQLILRIHRGRPCPTTTIITTTTTTTSNMNIMTSASGALTTSGINNVTQSRMPLSMHAATSPLSINCNRDEVHSMQSQQQQQQQQEQQEHYVSSKSSLRNNNKTRNLYEKVPLNDAYSSTHNILENIDIMTTTTTTTSAPTSSSINRHSSNVYNMLVHNTNDGGNRHRKSSMKTSLLNVNETTFNVDTNVKCKNVENHLNEEVLTNRYDSEKRDSKKQRGKRSVKFQVKRFKVETKAAKTLAIIVGGFIVCWLPFFTMYLIRAFCDHCIQPTIFSILFWLGYCNSAINPLIYALFSHEFRIAFKRIICRCVCTRSGFRASENFQMIAARALMAPATFHKTISGCSDDGDGDGLYFS